MSYRLDREPEGPLSGRSGSCSGSEQGRPSPQCLAEGEVPGTRGTGCAGGSPPLIPQQKTETDAERSITQSEVNDRHTREVALLGLPTWGLTACLPEALPSVHPHPTTLHPRADPAPPVLLPRSPGHQRLVRFLKLLGSAASRRTPGTPHTAVDPRSPAPRIALGHPASPLPPPNLRCSCFLWGWPPSQPTPVSTKLGPVPGRAHRSRGPPTTLP